MKKLIITAHPAQYGFTHKIANTIKTESEKSNDEVFIMDLYSQQWRQDFLSFQKPENINKTEKREKIQEKIS